MFIYYTLSKIWPPTETYVAQTVESLDEDTYEHSPSHMREMSATGSGNSEGDWEKDAAAMGAAGEKSKPIV